MSQICSCVCGFCVIVQRASYNRYTKHTCYLHINCCMFMDENLSHDILYIDTNAWELNEMARKYSAMFGMWYKRNWARCGADSQPDKHLVAQQYINYWVVSEYIWNSAPAHRTSAALHKAGALVHRTIKHLFIFHRHEQWVYIFRRDSNYYFFFITISYDFNASCKQLLKLCC